MVNGELTDVAKTWASALRDLTGEQIAEGLRAYVDLGEAWPPSVPEFKAMCKKQGVNEFGLNFVPQYHHGCYGPIRDRSRILSNDQRDAGRKVFNEKLHALADDLRGKNKIAKDTPKTPHIRDTAKYDALLMGMLADMRAHYPDSTITQRLVWARQEV